MNSSATGNTQTPGGPAMVIGLDGVTFDLIIPWAEQGHLPNLARLMQNGAWGPLKSTVPAHSGPAWVTFMTGLHPGRHGVYHFAGATRDEKYFSAMSSHSIRSRFFWDLIGEAGHSVGVINVPLTYPPLPVNGYMIAGLFAPDGESAFYDKALYDEVIAACDEYIVSAPVLQDRQAFLDALLEGMKNGLEVGEYLFEKHPTDLSIIVFRMIDSVMHRYWPDMDEQHPLHAELGNDAIPDGILNGYKLLDDAIGRLMAKAAPDTTFCVLSDHGFRADDMTFAFNKWLIDKGMLKLKSHRALFLSLVTRWTERLHLDMVLKKVGMRFIKAVAGENRYESWLYKTVDWSGTKVVFGPTMGMNINLKGRDYEGIVTEEEYEPLRDWLIEELSAIRAPETGLPIFNQVCRREDIYSGESLDLAPDVVIEMAEYVTNGRRWGYGIAPIFSEWRLFPPPARRLAGEHALEGAFIAAGPHIRPGKYEQLDIVDVAPTVMYSMGVATPEDMDGRAMTQIFDPTYVSDNPEQFSDIKMVEAHHTDESADSEYEDVVTERLRELGYIE
ncbi:MAG: alkaline phosphatase family protein [Anaerolineae bacterium]|nr:alkaline phosphatase family protein [Anaerolineae bacterium]